jgi:hypothetical protein
MFLTIGNNGNWFCEVPEELWPDSQELKDSLALDFAGETGDRRQELVFIGQIDADEKMAISDALNSCLLIDTEMCQYLDGDMADFEDPFEEWDDGQDEGQDDEEGLSHSH